MKYSEPNEISGPNCFEVLIKEAVDAVERNNGSLAEMRRGRRTVDIESLTHRVA